MWDSNHPNCSVTMALDTPVTPPVAHEWWWAFNWTKMPPVPDAASFTVDFNRHGKRQFGNGYTEKSMKMLFVDGHAATVSCKEAHYAIRFPANANNQGSVAGDRGDIRPAEAGQAAHAGLTCEGSGSNPGWGW